MQYGERRTPFNSKEHAEKKKTKEIKGETQAKDIEMKDMHEKLCTPPIINIFTENYI